MKLIAAIFLPLFSACIDSHEFVYSEDYFKLSDQPEYTLEYNLVQLNSLEIHNGINAWEAYALAHLYCTRNIKKCGIVEIPIAKDDSWLVKPVTIDNDVDEFIKIDMNTGAVDFKEMKADPHEILRVEVNLLKNAINNLNSPHKSIIDELE